MDSTTLPLVNNDNPIRDAIQKRMLHDRDHAYSTIINNASKKLQTTIEKFAKTYNINKALNNYDRIIQPVENKSIKESSFDKSKLMIDELTDNPGIKESSFDKIKLMNDELTDNPGIKESSFDNNIDMLSELSELSTIKNDKELNNELEQIISKLDLMNTNYKKSFDQIQALSNKLVEKPEIAHQNIIEKNDFNDKFVKSFEISNKKLAKSIIKAVSSNNNSVGITESDLSTFGTRMNRQNTSGSLLEKMPMGTPGDPIFMSVNNIDHIVNPIMKELKKQNTNDSSGISMPNTGSLPLGRGSGRTADVNMPDRNRPHPTNARRGTTPEIPNKPSPTLGERTGSVVGAVGKGLMRGATLAGAVEVADALIGLDDTLKEQLMVGSALLALPGALGRISAGIYGAIQLLDFAMQKYMPEHSEVAKNLKDIDTDTATPEELQGSAREQTLERKKEADEGGEGFQKFNERVKDFFGGISESFDELTEGISKTQITAFGHTFNDTSKMSEQADVLAQTSDKNKSQQQKEANAQLSSVVTNAVNTLSTTNNTVNNVYNTTQKVVAMVDPAISSASGSNSR